MKLAYIILASVCLILTSQAAVAGDRQAQERVAGFKKDQAALLAKFAALSQIDVAVRDDCAAHNKGKLATGEYCGCAAAVTMGLWRSGIDPNMMPRLTAYLNKPTESGAKEFLRYQGPELYRPLCNAGSKR
jgi:hypothetical protein